MTFCCVTMVRPTIFQLLQLTHMFIEFAFYVNKNGRRSRKNFFVHWEGTPTGFGRLLSLGEYSSGLY